MKSELLHQSLQTDHFVRQYLPATAFWPKFHFDGPALQYPERLNCAVELLERWVHEGHGERVAVRGRDVILSYRELLSLSNRIAHVLRDELQLIPGNRVLLRGFNDPMLAACWLAVIKAGCVAVTSLPMQRATELQAVIAQAEIHVALCDGSLAEELEQAAQSMATLQKICYYHRAEADSLETLLAKKPTEFTAWDTAAEDVALIAFTSGTTGVPKGSVHFQRDVLVMCDAFPQAMLQPQPEDVFCGSPSLAFTYGLGGLLCIPLRYGASTILLGQRQTAEALLQTIQTQGATICFAAPTLLRQMAALLHGERLKSLRCCVSAGEALPEATRQLWTRASGIEIIDGLGTTEMMHIFISHALCRHRPGAIGYAVPGYRLRILTAEGAEAALGEVGQLAVQGPTGCIYLGQESQQQAVYQGWSLTGDACYQDQDGYIYYQGRIDDMIVSAGYNIAGAEVEAVLLQHPAILECAVVGIPDVTRGQIVKAFIVLHTVCADQAAESLRLELQEFVKQRIAPYKYPRQIEFVRTLPRTENAKLQRYKLRAQSLPTSASLQNSKESSC